MKKMALTFALVVLILAVNVNASYVVDFHDDQAGASPNTAIVPSMSSDTFSCTAYLTGYATLIKNTMPITTTIEYFSPSDTSLISGSKVFTNNQSCFSYGTVSTSTISTPNNTYEGKITLTHDADIGIGYMRTTYVCNSGIYINVTIDGTTLDTRNNLISSYYKTKQKNCVVPAPYTVDEFSVHLDDTNYGVCATMEVDRFPPPISVGTGSDDRCQGLMLYFPVNSSSIGRIIYDLDCTNCFKLTSGGVIVDDDFRWVLYPTDNPTNENVLSATKTASGSITVTPDKQYVIAFFHTIRDLDIGETMGINAPDSAEYDIFSFVPDYSDCSDYSDCINTSQFRICNDTFGVAEPIFEYRTCAIGIIENATLGFENFVTTTDILKCEPQWILGCFYNIANITLDRPTNWTIIDPAYGKANFLQMTQEYATEGTRSLKMWQIPPKQGEVITSITCGNLTTSIIPQVFQGVSNTTFSVSHNVTFPAENMQVSFDVKKCPNQVLQHSAIVPLSWGNISLLTLCDEVCYSESCSVPPNGAYIFNILDTNTSLSIFGVPQFADAELQTLSPTYDISGLGIVAGRTYNIVFAISNENPNDATGNCIYIDNVRYEVTEESLLAFVPDCESRCLETTRIEASRTENGSCFIVIKEFSPLCIDAATAEAIENQEDFCSDSNTLQSFNEKTGKYEAIDCLETGKTCSGGRCQTEEEITDVSTIPAEDTQEFLGWFNWLFSPLFIFLIITLVFAGIVSKATTSGNKDGKGTFEIFGVVVIIMMIIGTLPGIAIIPVWVSIAIIVFIALMIAQVMGIFAGRG